MPRLLITWFVLSALVFSAKASHLVGGEIYYTCLGNNQYQITLKVYRDCNTVVGAEYDNPAYIGIFNSSGVLVEQLAAPFNGSEELPVIIDNPCLQAPPDVCVEEAIYTVTETLPPIAGGYHVAYQRCCRNPTIVNLVAPDDQGSTYTVHIPEAALNSCNSSPSFNSFPPVALCTGDLLEFDHSATDLDGDLLVYSLCSPYHGGDDTDPQPIPPLAPPYNTLQWGFGYNAANPMDGAPPISIDPNTGLLTCTPTQAGQYVVGVCVEEYRNGELLSSNNRDFQFNVVNCTSNIQAVIPPQPTFHDPCDGLEVDFGNQSINAEFYHWDFGVVGVNNDTSDIANPIFIYPDTGLYTVTLIANPSYPCADTTVSDVLVYNDVSVDIVLDGEQCFDVNSIDFEAIGNFGPGATFLWQFENATPATSTDANPQGIVFDTVGIYQIQVEVTEAVCSDQSTTTIEMYPRPQANFVGDAFNGCAPLGVLFIDSSLAATEHFSSWDFGDGSTDMGERVFHGYPEPGTYDVTLTVWTETGCVDTSVFTIPNAVTVWPLPTAELTVDPDTQFVFEPTFTFTGISNAVDCEIFPGDGTSYAEQVPNCTFEHFYTDTGNFQAIMFFTDANGCVNSDSVWIRVEPEVRFWVPNAFTPNGDRINDTWGPKAFGFSEYELWVFDRWGKMVFHTEDPFAQWNGRFNNESNLEPVIGVYAYRILARSVKNTVIREFGHVTVLR